MRTRRRQVHPSRCCTSARRRTRQTPTSGYDCALGEGISRDPVEEKGGLNLFGLLENGPISRVDKMGLLPLNPQEALELTFFQVSLRPGDCGAFIYRTTWSLNLINGHADPDNGGLIVQYVNAAFDVHLCDKDSSPYHFGPPSSNPIDPGYWPFYEAWWIPPGKNRPSTTTTYQDSWQMPGFGEGTQGSITIVGNAEYFDGETVPWYFSPGNAGPPMNGLPTSPWFLPPGAPTSTVTRTLTATWNCCCGSPTKKTTVTVTPDSYPH